MAWKKGQSGNVLGPFTEKPFREALRLEIAAAKDQKALRRIARALITKAFEGDLNSIREVADRLDGRVQQSTDVTVSHNTTPPNNLSDAELALRIAMLETELATRDANHETVN